MNYFEYLCGVYEICFRSPAKLNAADQKQHSKSNGTAKFYDYTERPITDGLIGDAGSDNRVDGDIGAGTTVNILGNVPYIHPTAAVHKFTQIAKSTNDFHNSDWDVVPKSCAGDWLLRYSQNETNFNPWHIGAKFSHFELVPWRRQHNKRIDLTNAIGWEPFKLTPATQQQLRTLQKFELARSKRLQKQRLKSQQQQRAKFRRQIKIRFIFALEVRQKRLKLFRANRGDAVITPMSLSSSSLSTPTPAAIADAATYQRKLILQRDQQLYVFNQRAYDLTEHWGYFSQRYKGVDEMLVKNKNASQMDLSCMKKCLTYYPANGILSSKMSSSSSPPVMLKNTTNNSQSNQASEVVSGTNQQQQDTTIISCEKCQCRCVIWDFFFYF